MGGTVQVLELWHFPNQSNSLFRDFIATLYARKYEASGWPSHANTQEEREEEVRQLRERYDINIRPECVEPNPGIHPPFVSHLCQVPRPMFQLQPVAVFPNWP